MKTTDGELLRHYAVKRSEAAFEELVRRRINLVYSAALRQVNNDPHLAEDVTQSVFIDLARKAATLSQHASLIGWLYTSTRYVAGKLCRAQHRRALRETEAHAMNTLQNEPEPEADWVQIRPWLDEAMHVLSELDREAVLLRHFQQLSYAEIGLRFGLSEDAARMRVSRALAQLQEILSKRGVTSTGAVLAMLLGHHAIGAAPAQLTARVVSAAMAGTAGTGGMLGLGYSKIAAAVAGVVLITGLFSALIHYEIKRRSADVPARQPTANQSISAPAVAPVSMTAVTATSSSSGLLFSLRVITADTGEPIPDVAVECEIMEGFSPRRERTQWRCNRIGVCNLTYPKRTSRIFLTAEKPPFADVCVRWQRPLGDELPTNYVLRMERAVAISGTVVDADGSPIAGATVTWQLAVPDSRLARTPRIHEYYGTKYETTSDTSGRWQLARMAEAILPYLTGQAADSNHLDSSVLSTARDVQARQQLRDGIYAFQLGTAVTLRGVVVDESGNPVSGAFVSVAGARSGLSQMDGTFVVNGCAPGKQPVGVTAPGFVGLAASADVQDNAAPLRLVLQTGKLLCLRLKTLDDTPVLRAAVMVVNSESNAQSNFSVPTPSLQYTDQQGLVSWSNAPDADLRFQVFADGLRVLNGRTNEARGEGFMFAGDIHHGASGWPGTRAQAAAPPKFLPHQPIS